jgi:hypothetical protein
MSQEEDGRGEACEREDAEPGADSPEAGREDSADGRPRTRITPVAEKIGEGEDNLRKRSDWYQRRTGRTP